MSYTIPQSVTYHKHYYECNSQEWWFLSPLENTPRILGFRTIRTSSYSKQKHFRITKAFSLRTSMHDKVRLYRLRQCAIQNDKHKGDTSKPCTTTERQVSEGYHHPPLAVEHELLDFFLNSGELLHWDRLIIRPWRPCRWALLRNVVLYVVARTERTQVRIVRWRNCCNIKNRSDQTVSTNLKEKINWADEHSFCELNTWNSECSGAHL